MKMDMRSLSAPGRVVPLAARSGLTMSLALITCWATATAVRADTGRWSLVQPHALNAAGPTADGAAAVRLARGGGYDGRYDSGLPSLDKNDPFAKYDRYDKAYDKADPYKQQPLPKHARNQPARAQAAKKAARRGADVDDEYGNKPPPEDAKIDRTRPGGTGGDEEEGGGD